MSIPVSVQKEDETDDRCTYVFSGPDDPMGRLVVDKDTGHIEVDSLADSDASPNERHYLAHVVPRLQTYHEQGTYPDADEWTL